MNSLTVSFIIGEPMPPRIPKRLPQCYGVITHKQHQVIMDVILCHSVRPNNAAAADQQAANCPLICLPPVCCLTGQQRPCHLAV